MKWTNIYTDETMRVLRRGHRWWDLWPPRFLEEGEECRVATQ